MFHVMTAPKMPLISLTVKHDRTQEDEARRRLETAVHEISAKFGVMLPRVEWAADRNQVRLEGVGFWIEMWVDALAVHVTGRRSDPGAAARRPTGLATQHIVEETFQKRLP